MIEDRLLLEDAGPFEVLIEPRSEMAERTNCRIMRVGERGAIRKVVKRDQEQAFARTFRL
jgi:hypothetical protein